MKTSCRTSFLGLTVRSARSKAGYSFTKREFTRALRLLELAGRLKERQRTFLVGDRKRFDTLIKRVLDLEFQLEAWSSLESELRRLYGKKVEGLTSKEYWVYFSSPPGTWKKMCGREGWYVFDYEKLKSKAFIVTRRN